MASLFKPEVPQQDPAVAKQQQDEQARAEASRTRALQDQLGQETNIVGRKNGTRSLLGAFGSGISLLGSN